MDAALEVEGEGCESGGARKPRMPRGSRRRAHPGAVNPRSIEIERARDVNPRLARICPPAARPPEVDPKVETRAFPRTYAMTVSFPCSLL